MIGVEAWEQAVAASGLPPLHSRRVEPGFRAGLRTHELGTLRLTELVTPPGACFRDPASVRAADAGFCQVDVIAAGRVRVEQDGATAELGRADLVVTDPARPVTVTSTASTHMSMLVPRRLLRLDPDDLARLSAVRIRGDRGPGAAVSSLLRTTTRALHGLPAPEGARWGAAVAELLAVALSAELGRPDPDAAPPGRPGFDPDAAEPGRLGFDPGAARSGDPDNALRARVLAHIEARLGDRTLVPGLVAAAHHISVRRLHQLFASQPETVAALIRRRRLERCHADLADPAHRTRTVAAVAARWGFADAAHFSRLFKAAYGLTATEHRIAHASPPSVRG